MTSERGFALPAVLFMLIIVGIVSVAAFNASDDETRSDKAFRESGLARYAAEAGLRATLSNWPTASVEALNPGDSVVVGGGWTTMANRTSYRVVIYKVDNGTLQQFMVFSSGKRPSAIGGQATVSMLVSGVPLFKWGVLAKGDISLSGSTSLVDAFNSGLGAYGGANIDNTSAKVGSDGNISLVGAGATINGSASATGTISGGVTGTSTAGAPAIPIPANLTCPAGGYTSAAVVAALVAASGGSHTNYNPVTGVLSINGDNINLTYPAGGFYYFSSISLGGGATLTLASGGKHVDIYVDNQVSMSGGAGINNAGAPTLLSLLACGSPGSPAGWTLHGGTDANFAVYAPNHDVTITGGSQISGAILANNLTESGGTAIHFDTALMNTPSVVLALLTGSWAQLSVF